MQADEQNDGQDDSAAQDTIAQLRADLAETQAILMQLQKACMAMCERLSSAEKAIAGNAELTGKIIAELNEQQAKNDPDDPFNIGHLGEPG